MKRFVRRFRRLPRSDHRFDYLSDKQYAALKFWDKEIDNFIAWYNGEISEHYQSPAPSEAAKVKDYDQRLNAIWTWVRRDSSKYPNALRIRRDHFVGKTVLDIGCGPIPYLLAFEDCQLIGLDNLVNEYREVGYPLDEYSPRLKYVAAPGEQIPLPTSSVDAVISVNAIDHVDKFATTAREVIRVLKPDGIVRMQIHYHNPTLTEPWKLDDAVVLQSFAPLGLNKIHEEPYTGNTVMTVWST
ncbi:MAG: class I SAM-dependent methyltransferase [Anaerolineae bacterium]|nr:class I SAM-dependent methyltransferase [Anaerolineae bacterium]